MTLAGTWIGSSAEDVSSLIAYLARLAYGLALRGFGAGFAAAFLPRPIDFASAERSAVYPGATIG
jgi:hypothetical protein